MKKLFTRMITMFLLTATICNLMLTSAFAATTTRYNVSYSPVTCNASSGSLPTGQTTVYTGDKIYFNFQVDSSQKIKTVYLYYKAPGSSSYTKKTETATNYLRYAYFSYTVGSTAGTLKYYFKVTDTSGKTTTYSTQSITVKKGISTNYSGTSSTTSSSYYVTVNGTKITAGNTFYTYYKSGSTYKKSTGGDAYYVKVGSSYVNVKAAQCMGFAHYIEYLLYGKYDGTTSTLNSGFTQIAKNVTTTSSNAKTYITKAGAGAHIRTQGSYTHSLIVLSVTSDGFYYVDANGTSGNNIIRIGYYTWSAFAKKYTSLQYIRYYTN